MVMDRSFDIDPNLTTTVSPSLIREENDGRDNTLVLYKKYSRREAMFEKVLMPSDVGKLNRLVIPKQYAEKYFPIIGCSGEDILSFEDEEAGKLWRFRYSYWTSSQSYVLTKGWSHFVKDKCLDAGDVVLFHRQLVDGRCLHLFISWRRRSSISGAAQPTAPSSLPGAEPKAIVKKPSGKSKILRLFGVNIECPIPPDESEPPNSDHHTSSMSNKTTGGCAAPVWIGFNQGVELLQQPAGLPDENVTSTSPTFD